MLIYDQKEGLVRLVLDSPCRSSLTFTLAGWLLLAQALWFSKEPPLGGVLAHEAQGETAADMDARSIPV